MRIYKISLCFIILALYTTVTNAQKKKNDGFIIHGNIDYLENDVTVYLTEIDGQKVLDSTKSINGAFVLKGKVKEPTGCWIQYKDKYTIIMVENIEMTYSSSLKNIGNAKVKGGREQQLRNELQALQSPYDKLAIEASDSLRNNLYTDKKHKEALIKKVNTNGENSHTIYIEFGKKNYNSFLGLDILYRNRQRIGRDSIKIRYKKLDRHLKKTEKAEALRIFSTEVLAEKGETFIDFKAKKIDGKAFKLSSLKGQYILLTFGSAGCVYCGMQNQYISKNHDKFKNKISFVNFSIDKNKEAWFEANEKNNITWTNVSDLQGNGSKTKNLYNVQAVPTSFLINKEGIIVEIFDGYTYDFLDKIEKMLN